MKDGSKQRKRSSLERSLVAMVIMRVRSSLIAMHSGYRCDTNASEALRLLAAVFLSVRPFLKRPSEPATEAPQLRH
jgi:hypothetical protein